MKKLSRAQVTRERRAIRDLGLMVTVWTRKPRRSPEHDEQRALFSWAALMSKQIPELAYLFAVPNGARTSMSVAKKLKAEGLKAGVPDIFLPVPKVDFWETKDGNDYHGLWIEMKAAKGKLSADQKRWITFLESQGYKCCVCYSWLQAKDVILTYLGE